MSELIIGRCWWNPLPFALFHCQVSSTYSVALVQVEEVVFEGLGAPSVISRIRSGGMKQFSLILTSGWMATEIALTLFRTV